MLRDLPIPLPWPQAVTFEELSPGATEDGTGRFKGLAAHPTLQPSLTASLAGQTWAASHQRLDPEPLSAASQPHHPAVRF